MACPACGSGSATPLLRVPSVPALCNVLYTSRERAVAAPRGEIRLTHCSECGLIANEAFDPRLVEYHGDYENALHFSPHFRQYAAELARELVDAHGLRGKRVAEIGCGDGSFLGELCRIGGCTGIGYDPAFDASRAGVLPPGVSIIPRLFGPETVGEPPDFLCCRHVLEHIADPLAFLRDIRRAMGERPEAAVYFEVPDAQWMLRERGIWDVIYEHCLYFTGASMTRVMAAAGFTPDGSRSMYGGQFLTIRASPGKAQPWQGSEDDAAMDDLVAGFAAAYAERVQEWRTRLADLRARGHSAVVWGGGSKGAMFLNSLGEHGQTVLYVVDINPRKHGCFIAGTGQRIVEPGALRDIQPSAVILMNPVYREEVAALLSSMGLRPELLAA
jgi:hypothetical protein